MFRGFWVLLTLLWWTCACSAAWHSIGLATMTGFCHLICLYVLSAALFVLLRQFMSFAWASIQPIQAGNSF
jgi:hypothetical protein